MDILVHGNYGSWPFCARQTALELSHSCIQGGLVGGVYNILGHIFSIFGSCISVTAYDVFIYTCSLFGSGLFWPTAKTGKDGGQAK